jgi:hypothetical protein
MYTKQEDGWIRIEQLLLRAYLLFHMGSGLVELVARKISEISHSIPLW